MQVVVGHLPDLAVFALPDRRDGVAPGLVGRSVSIDDVVGDVKSPARIPVRKLRPVLVVSNPVVRLVELDSEIVDDLVPEPVDAAFGFTVEIGRRPLDQFVVVVDSVLAHEGRDVRRLGERLVGIVDDLVDVLESAIS